eukprot:TRINITY_DN678_c0_g1_i9.p1 TRINITY_DN678_c0_g1~~TRINITY_DN678_c0_g1_i9.p1  ORF type:complete len:654 (+),score=168.67 TRINITY_DN678_c0_g1_i9:414-2375(+)
MEEDQKNLSGVMKDSTPIVSHMEHNGLVKETPVQKHLKAEAHSSPDDITLFWKDLTFRVPVKDSKNLSDRIVSNPNFAVIDGKPMKNIIQNLTGYAKPRELIGLLGPSGSGKTVLLNIFSDRLVTTNGCVYNRNVFINKNVPLTRTLFGKKCAYVMQDDVLLDTLTPYECLCFSANLRLSTSQEEKEQSVMRVIEALRLQTCMNTLVGSVLKKGISGGERRRTSIGVEIVTNPSLIILDEVTSGLDSFTAYTIVKVLKEMAESGKTIIAIVHQPSSDIFSVFDRTYILAGGREVYQGDTEKICDYFKMIGKEIPSYTNPADRIIVMMHAKENPDPEDLQKQNELFDSYNRHIRPELEADIPRLAEVAPELDEESLKIFRASGFGLQFQQLLNRAFKNFIRNSIATWVNLAQVIIISLVMIILFWNKEANDETTIRERNGAIIAASTYHLLHSTNTVLLTFPLERNLFVREQSNRMYGVLPYYLAKMIVELPCHIIMPIIYCLITYWAIRLRNETDSFFIFTCSVLMIAIVGNSIGLLLGSMFADFRIAIGVVPIIIIPLLLFAGFMANVEEIVVWLRWLQYISPIRYTFEIGLRAEYKPEDFPVGTPGNPVEYPVDHYNLHLGMGWCFGIMAFMVVGVRILGYFFLKLQTINA